MNITNAERTAWWIKLFDKIMWNSIQERHWKTPWFQIDHKLADGNPIFSAVNHSTKRGLRIIEYYEDECNGTFDPNTCLLTYFDYFAKSEPEQILELVINVGYPHADHLNNILETIITKWTNI